jgi:hypothetical protein
MLQKAQNSGSLFGAFFVKLWIGPGQVGLINEYHLTFKFTMEAILDLDFYHVKLWVSFNHWR